ncbi:amino acid ABC transporter substrate-binding protein, PAAT family [Arsukibacterium tuosuense]|uniref:Amino acid ABC transporter substrate-binding protein, PAAT family n=1 Tax=Arsukibacterium tuosuense TaxID=1323745 RepID=A0A285I256_9GAMM|nr:amino acid ABC transporter [Arsukibacterium tuosuense]SNY42045.1 amino acid ABC transporter substrate-binding protein, PAAT family [Arsukibacterium tuosuense]
MCRKNAEVVILRKNRQRNIVAGLIGAVLSTTLIAVKAEPVPGNSKEQVTLRFCYEDKQLLPYYAGNSTEVPVAPGAAIEHLQRATAAVGISLSLVRMPWLRCLQQLADNKVDALVAAYSPEREHYTVYPRDELGKPDPSKAINTNALCLTHRFDNNLQIKMADSSAKLTIARPYGYRPIPLPEHAVLVGAHSPEQALELVVSGRVDATTITCQINGLAGNRQEIDTLPLKILQPPVYFSVGYLMLSEEFYQQHPANAENLWQVLPTTLNRERYIEYLAYPLGF